MARLQSNIPLVQLRKEAGKLMVIKQYSHGLVVTKYPDMSKIKATKKQKVVRSKFKEAVAYAQSILQDDAQRKLYQQKVKPPQTIYHFALQEYMKNHL
jgi:hypothetical protein